MELYLSDSVDKLNSMAELPDKFKQSNPKRLAVAAIKLLNQAVELRDRGDTESSYVSFVKYLNVVSTIRNTPEYKNNEKVYNDSLGKKNIRDAIENAEKLNQELRRRYEDRAEKIFITQKLEKQDINERFEKKALEEKLTEKNTKHLQPEYVSDNLDSKTISSWELEAMIKQQSTSFIIFDVRSKEDFENSHIMHQNCVSIPEDKLKAGISADILFRTLPVESRIHWPKRLTVDVIVLVDWFGENIPGSAIYAIEEIFTKWDPSSTYKGVIKVLTKGYNDWLSRFPMKTTNPLVTSDVKPAFVADFSPVDEIEYPDLDEALKPPTEDINARSQPHVNRTTKPAIEIRRIDEPTIGPSSYLASQPKLHIPRTPSEVITDSTTVNQTWSVPQIDRNLKNNAKVKHLRDEEKLVEKQLAITVERLEKEKEWDLIRSQKEASVNSEIANQLQEREEQMLEMLRRMESENKQQELEIVRLRKEVENYQDAVSNISGKMKPDEEEETIQARITEKELQKQALYREVETLRELRKKKEKILDIARSEKIEEGKKKEKRLMEEQQKKIEQQRLNDEKQKIIEQHLKEEELKKMKEEEIKKKRTEELKKKKEEDLKRIKEESIERELAAKRLLEQQRPNVTKSDHLRIDKLKDDQSSSGFGLGSKMNRSHSTPDLAQALQKESEQLDSKTPKVDRELKPLTPNRTQLIPRHDLSKNRNFNPVYGTMGRGLTGLKNLGNTCYMNSILQCISNCTLLTGFFSDGSYRKYINTNNKQTRGEIADEVSSTLSALWSGQYRSISCKDLKNAVGRYKSSFRGFEQQDSHEFLTILVDWLHEELNEIRVKRPLIEQNNYGIPDEKAANMAWQDYTNSNKSIIVTLFAGQQRSSLRCTACSKESVTFEPFFNLSLPIPPTKNECSIMECFNLYTKPEQISGWSCPFCKNKKGASKTIDIWKLPPILVVHLQRFYNDGLWRKRLTKVDFSLNELDLEGVVKSNNPRYSRFKLYAVSNHYGTMDAGHYTAYCKNSEYNKWFKFDDQDVMEISGNEVRSAAAYILFYTAIDYQAPLVVHD